MKEYRLLQVFLSPRSANPGPGIFEVSADVEKNLRCTCPGFKSMGECRHTKFVYKRIEENDGIYPFELSEAVSKEETEKAFENASAFREFVLKYGKIEVF
jgi:hypothetical protein